jgi:hypothetical protein
VHAGGAPKPALIVTADFDHLILETRQANARIAFTEIGGAAMSAIATDCKERLTMYDNLTDLKEAEKEQMDTAVVRHQPNWTAGVILIGIGVIFLIANTTGFTLNNWWALFILIPAVSNFGHAWRSYQANGRLTRGARGSLTGGLILALLASAFLFELNWGLIWPLFLIVGGISALLGGWFD